MQDTIQDVLFQEIPKSNPRLEILKTHFPECFDKMGNFLVDKFQESLGGGGRVEFSKESYSLNWLGKSYASVLRNEPAKTWIKPDKTFNSTHPNSQNFLIKGDNLEALKLLKNAYEKKIKMIYIDPPYNTGNNDFVYKDDRKYTPKELSSLCGMSEEECKKMLEYYSKGKNSHSAWLTFMYPRLSLARNLLKEDGVIFISIDENEQANLKILCDEIFGEENFVGDFVWKTRQASGKQISSNNFSKEHENILCYQKNSASFFGISRNSEAYTNPDNDSRGIWAKHPLDVGSTKDERPNCFYTLIDPNTGNEYYPNPNRVWAFSKESMERLISEGKVIFDKEGKKKPYLKKFWNELKTETKPISSWLDNKTFNLKYNTEGTKVLNDLFQGIKIFDYPKPISLIKLLINQICHNSSNDQSLTSLQEVGQQHKR